MRDMLKRRSAPIGSKLSVVLGVRERLRVAVVVNDQALKEQ